MKLNKKNTESLIAIFHPNTVGFVESSANSFEKFNKIQYKLQKIFWSTNWCINVVTKGMGKSCNLTKSFTSVFWRFKGLLQPFTSLSLHSLSFYGVVQKN